MMRLIEIAEDADTILAEFRSEAREGRTFQDVSQRLMNAFQRRFSDSGVLARTYATVPFSMLPPRDRTYVETLVQENGMSDLLHDGLPVLSLLGTSGIEEAWCHRYSSRGHLAIPLLSQEFVAGIPMVSGIINRLGSSLQWYKDLSVPSGRKESFGVFTESFFVPDASSTRDSTGRLLIPAQDFVKAYNVQTVFGVGGEFSATGTILVCIFFTSESLSQTPKWLLRLPLILGLATQDMVAAGEIFDRDA